MVGLLRVKGKVKGDSVLGVGHSGFSEVRTAIKVAVRRCFVVLAV